MSNSNLATNLTQEVQVQINHHTMPLPFSPVINSNNLFTTLDNTAREAYLRMEFKVNRAPSHLLTAEDRISLMDKQEKETWLRWVEGSRLMVRRRSLQRLTRMVLLRQGDQAVLVSIALLE